MDLQNVASIRGSDLDGLALTEKVRMVKADVMKEFPQTGGAMDAVLGLLGMIGAAGSVVAQRKRLLIG
jgi:LPXTG-motif cell wall-anchored protein